MQIKTLSLSQPKQVNGETESKSCWKNGAIFNLHPSPIIKPSQISTTSSCSASGRGRARLYGCLGDVAVNRKMESQSMELLFVWQSARPISAREQQTLTYDRQFGKEDKDQSGKV